MECVKEATLWSLPEVGCVVNDEISAELPCLPAIKYPLALTLIVEDLEATILVKT